MGANASSSQSAPPSPSRWTLNRQNSTTKQIHISTNHADGFHFTGERLYGTVKIPTSFLHSKSNQTPTELLNKRSLRSAIIVELVGDATYSSQVDTAADSDGHATHKVNLCRHRSVVTLNQTKSESDTPPLPSSSSSSPNNSNSSLTIPPSILNGTFQLHIPDGLPPSLIDNRTPSVVYTLELSLSSSRYRYQIPIILSSRGAIPHPMTDLEISDSAVTKNDLRLSASIPYTFYRPGEQVPVRINYSNPQLRFVRSITIRLIQVYRVHNDQHRAQLDGKEWSFDVLTMSPQRQWTGEARLQLLDHPLQASYSPSIVGTTQKIECELAYRISVELNEKKGDDLHLTLPAIQVTYQK